ncbi:Methyltransferase domain-containing protein [Mucilaginibacter mallensis]|uniref:Methyltransferase domain-containing protein n=1 Tax=Mucilaginibacter mallensis TaxID=652787 RepID=A0A1H1SYU8_MUCMA|nr:class I SAM-dependent methyltransferase [Mucilaginibacter mallensis]SDS53162.1 Methyltransferase domain-containing protein [Mucilaginibacter mallensis]
MSDEDAISLIGKAVSGHEPQVWVDLGCGSGTFTKALNSLLPVGSHIIAVDREKQQLNLPNVDFLRANFERDDLKLSGLDGILMANAIHYVAEKAALIRKLEPMFTGSPRFIMIEYDTDRANPWVPFPIPFKHLQTLFGALGYHKIVKISERPSTYRSGNMYCTLIEK